MSHESGDTGTAVVPAKRPPGRPKGYPKTGGRQPGVVNRSTVELRDYIKRRGDPITFLCGLVRGVKVWGPDPDDPTKRKWIVPTLELRTQAALALAKKIAPDMKAVDVSTDGEGGLVIKLVSYMKAGDGDGANP